MNEIMTFSNSEFGEIRTVTIDEETWFVGKDVAKSLGYVKPLNALRDNVDKDDSRRQGLTDSMGRTQDTIIINESGLYSLIFNSKLESAKKFKKWVTSEVLPTIHKTGSYGQPQLPQTTDGKIALLAQGHVELKAEIDSVKADLEQFKTEMPILGIEEKKISDAVKKKGVECLGGKTSNAYSNRSLQRKVYSDIYHQLYREFGNITTYKAIKRNQADTALEIICGYRLPLNLADTIAYENAQQTLEV